MRWWDMARTVGSVGAETAKRVLKEALRLFAREGYAAVSMRQIAGKCGLQAGALYNHFPTKQAILNELMVTHLESLLAAYDETPDHASPLDALEAFARFHIAYHIDKPEEVFIAYMELRNLETGNLGPVMKLRQQYERCLRGILRNGVASGDFEIDDVPVTAMAIISMMTGVNTWFRYGGRLSIREIETIYVNMIFALVGKNDQRMGNSAEEEKVNV